VSSGRKYGRGERNQYTGNFCILVLVVSFGQYLSEEDVVESHHYPNSLSTLSAFKSCRVQALREQVETRFTNRYRILNESNLNSHYYWWARVEIGLGNGGELEIPVAVS
jgi:hypothetical protein